MRPSWRLAQASSAGHRRIRAVPRMGRQMTWQTFLAGGHAKALPDWLSQTQSAMCQRGRNAFETCFGCPANRWVTPGHWCFCLLASPHLSQNGKVGLMGAQRKHHQVCVQAVQAVASVGVPPWAPALLPDVGHDLVLPLPRGIGVRQDHLQTAGRQ